MGGHGGSHAVALYPYSWSDRNQHSLFSHHHPCARPSTRACRRWGTSLRRWATRRRTCRTATPSSPSCCRTAWGVSGWRHAACVRCFGRAVALRLGSPGRAAFDGPPQLAWKLLKLARASAFQRAAVASTPAELGLVRLSAAAVAQLGATAHAVSLFPASLQAPTARRSCLSTSLPAPSRHRCVVVFS